MISHPKLFSPISLECYYVIKQVNLKHQDYVHKPFKNQVSDMRIYDKKSILYFSKTNIVLPSML